MCGTGYTCTESIHITNPYVAQGGTAVHKHLLVYSHACADYSYHGQEGADLGSGQGVTEILPTVNKLIYS